MTPLSPILEANDIVVRYATRGSVFRDRGRRRSGKWVHAVDGVSLGIAPGEMLALVGESGCGKTTTAKALLRLVDVDQGAINFDGQDVTSASARNLRRFRRRVQAIYQDPYESLDPRFRVRQTLEEPMLIHKVGAGAAERRERILDALSRVELTPAELYLDRFPHELSGGQRQRVAIAASLVIDAELLIADEPVSMLDVSVRAGILSLLDSLRKERKLGVLMITHDLSTAAQFADRIAVMYLGRIVEQGPARTVVREPKHPYTKALLSVVPRRHPHHTRRRPLLLGEPPDASDIPSGCRFRTRCQYAQTACAQIDPALRKGTDTRRSDHDVACILA